MSIWAWLNTIGALMALVLSGTSFAYLRYAQDLQVCPAVWNQRMEAINTLPRQPTYEAAKAAVDDVIRAIPSPHWFGQDICDY